MSDQQGRDVKRRYVPVIMTSITHSNFTSSKRKKRSLKAYSFAVSVTDGIRSQMRFPKCYRTISERPRMILHGYKSGGSEFQSRGFVVGNRFTYNILFYYSR